MPPRWSWEAQKCRRTWGVTTSGQSGRCEVAALARAARKGLVTDPGRRRIAVLPLGWQQRDAGPSVVVTEVTPHVLDEPPQRLARIVDQRDHPFPGPGTTSALAMTDVQLAESAQVPLDVGQVEFAHLVDPQPDLGHQPAGGVVAGGRRELPAGRQLFAPPANRWSTWPAVGGIRSLACCRPRGRLISSIGHSTTRPVIWWISTLCRSSRNRKWVFSACARDSRVPLAAARSTSPKYRSASGDSISHNGRPSQARTCSRCITSAATVPSASPAAARASTNPASTSVSSATRSAAVTGARATRRSRTAASPTLGPLAFTESADRTD